MTASHLDDAAFAELWTSALAVGQEPARHPHLDECAECRVRFGSFCQWMIDIRDDAVGEANELLSPERLAAQQSHIFRRIEAAERPARVIAFPKHAEGTLRRTPVHRWIAAAAAAGLIAGLGLGQMLDLRHRAESSLGRHTPPPMTLPTQRPAAVPAVGSGNEDVALADLEAVSTPRYEALRAYDTFTPRAADLIQPR
jgi:hypothetical protein